MRFWTALQLYEMAIDIVPNKYEMHTILRYLAPISITLGLDENTFIKTYTKYKNELLGIKIRLSPYVCPHDPQGALEKVVHISKQLGIRMEVHPNDAAIEDGILFNMLRKNDIYTHTYHPSRVGILDENGNIKRCVLDARKRGVIFDTAHGVSSLSVTILKQALEQGFEPDMISTDLHNGNINGPVFDLPTTISKFINLGMPLQRALYKVTIAPTEIFNLKKQTEIMIDKEADIAAFTLQKGKFDFSDGDGHKFTGNQFLSPEFTILHSEVFFPN